MDSEEAFSEISRLIASLRVELAEQGYPIVGSRLQYAIDFELAGKPLPSGLDPILVRVRDQLCGLLRDVAALPVEEQGEVEQRLRAELKTI